MRNYNELVQTILTTGRDKTDRTGVGTKSIFGSTLRFDLSQGFPAVTTKRLFWKGVVGELLWFMQGSTNVEHLRRITFGPDATNKTIWDDNYNKQAIDLGYSSGYLGPVYGKQWRSFGNKKPVDQLQRIINEIKSNPDSRRLLISAWNPEDLDAMALPPCHFAFQFEVYDGKLSLVWYQRSVDVFLGLPYNIASYALLTHIVASMCDLEVGELVFMGADIHVYNNHREQCLEQISRTPYLLPTLKMPKIESLGDLIHLKPDDFVLEDYRHHPAIFAPMAV